LTLGSFTSEKRMIKVEKNPKVHHESTGYFRKREREREREKEKERKREKESLWISFT
jgi:hypothetical protein